MLIKHTKTTQDVCIPKQKPLRSIKFPIARERHSAVSKESAKGMWPHRHLNNVLYCI